MFGTLKGLERELEVQILDSTRVFLRDHGSVRALPRGELRKGATGETPVFDVPVEKLGDVRTGAWERRAAESWHARLLESA